MQKISGLVEAGDNQNLLPVTLDFWRAAGKDRVGRQVFVCQTQRPTDLVKRGSDWQRLYAV